MLCWKLPKGCGVYGNADPQAWGSGCGWGRTEAWTLECCQSPASDLLLYHSRQLLSAPWQRPGGPEVENKKPQNKSSSAAGNRWAVNRQVWIGHRNAACRRSVRKEPSKDQRSRVRPSRQVWCWWHRYCCYHFEELFGRRHYRLVHKCLETTIS